MAVLSMGWGTLPMSSPLRDLDAQQMERLREQFGDSSQSPRPSLFEKKTEKAKEADEVVRHCKHGGVWWGWAVVTCGSLPLGVLTL